MAIPTNVETLLSGNVVETERIEFKKTWDPASSLKTICAFANDLDNWGGGYIVVGIDDNINSAERIVGVPSASVDKWLKDILNKCKLIQPAYMPITEVCTYNNKTLIVIWAPGGSQRPYSSPKSMTKNSDRIYWIRKMSSTISPSEEEKRDLYNLANNVPFDDRINHEANIDDLNPVLVKSYLKEIGSTLYSEFDSLPFETVCRNIGIVDGPAEYTKPKNVGLMFFNMNPEKFFPYAQIDIVELPEGEGGNIIKERTFTGPLNLQLQEAMLYLSNNVIEEYVIKVPDQVEAIRFKNYPYAALEEALANAVYHKGYDSREPIEVRVLPDRIEVLSHPGADRSITIEGLRAFRAVCRRYRNRRIGEFLKELHLTEGRNTGIHKILRSLRENGSPEPVFETDENRLYFLVTIFSHKGIGEEVGESAGVGECAGAGLAFVSGNSASGKNTVAGKNMEESGAYATGKAEAASKTVASNEQRAYNTTLSERQQLLLTFFNDNPTGTVKDASEALGVSESTLRREIAFLKGEGLLTHEGSTKAGRWVSRRAIRV